MNANELADELEKSPDLWFKDKTAGDWVIATLRKQEQELEYWKEMFEKSMEIQEK